MPTQANTHEVDTFDVNGTEVKQGTIIKFTEVTEGHSPGKVEYTGNFHGLLARFRRLAGYSDNKFGVTPKKLERWEREGRIEILPADSPHDESVSNALTVEEVRSATEDTEQKTEKEHVLTPGEVHEKVVEKDEEKERVSRGASMSF